MSESGVQVMYTDIPFDELDKEALEDIEVSLYGMLHHAPSDEFFNATYRDVIDDQNPLMLKTKTTETKEALSEPTKKNPKQKSFANKLKFISDSLKESKPLQSNINGRSLQPPKPKYNPYSEYLVVKSDHSRRVSEVITLSDDEDSRYQTIAKSSSNFSKKIISPIIISTPEESNSDDSIIILEEQSTDFFKIGSQNQIQNHASQSESSSGENSEVELIDSSCSSPIDTNRIQLNLSGTSENCNLSDSIRNGPQTLSWKSYSSKKWTPEMIEFYNRGGDGVDLDAVLHSLPRNAKWTLDAEDLHGNQKNRYFGSKRSRVKCVNCSQWDHVTKNCPLPKKVANCNICGMPGHRQFGCPSKCCLGCGKASRILIECCLSCRHEKNAVCMICRFNHFTKNCPDLWRRYHSTTTQQDKPNAPSDRVLKSSGPLYCSNCARPGHLAVDCREFRWSKFSPVSPAVFSYEGSRKFLESVTANGQNVVVNMSDDRKSVWVVEPPTPERSLNKRGSKTDYLRLSADGAPPDGTFQSVKKHVLAEIKNVNITWRNQVKKRHVLVEFTGQGNVNEAKKKFKKMIHFKMDRKKADNSSPCKDSANKKESTGTQSEEPVGKRPSKRERELKKEPKITSVSVVQLNNESKEMRRTVRCQLIDKEKKNLGSLLSKMETKYRVRITSSITDKSWEIVINNLTRKKLSSPFYNIIRYLDSASARPVGL